MKIDGFVKSPPAALRVGSKCSSHCGGTVRRPAFAENLYLINRSEVPPSGGALNPDTFLRRVLWKRRGFEGSKAGLVSILKRVLHCIGYDLYVFREDVHNIIFFFGKEVLKGSVGK